MSTLPPDQQARYLEVLDAAMHWMSRPVKAFGGKAPAAMVTTRLETETVIEFIRRLEHGFIA